MKNLITKAFFAVACLMTLMSFSASAQEMPQLPVDPNVRIGKLDNGLTYYIRHNETPKGQADFYIAQKVGSVLEEDNQRGLAHFLEHMCFNGTTHFPGNGLRDWLESIGVKFGWNLNAYTSIDETVYNISNVPVERESVQDSCLLILHDWADDLTLAPEEIDKERGVIHEEWRRSMVGTMRIYEKVLPTIYQNGRYGYRLPIGIMDVVDNFPYQALRDYYETWYRPDQQGVIVVGDIDVDRIEAKIKEMFADIKMPENPKTREYFPVEDNKGTIYAIGTDKEQNNSQVLMFFKHDVLPAEYKNTPAYLAQNYINTMISNMMASRLRDIISKADAPFAQASVYYGEFFVAKTKDALALTLIGKGNDIRPAFESAYRELLRAARGGFTVTEYERARKEYLSQLETLYNNREKTESENYVNEYVRNFVDGDPIPGIEAEYQIINMLASQVPVDMINQALKEYVTDDNRVIACFLPEKEEVVVPTEKDFADIVAKVDAENIEPYVDEVKSEPLIEKLPAKGSIAGEKELSTFGATELTLSNGIKVVVKSTKFKGDEIIVHAFAKGGTNVISDDEAANLIFLPYATNKVGFGTYTSSDMTKYLQGKQVSYQYNFEGNERTLQMTATPRDLQTAMEILYMAFADPTINAEEFEAYQKQLIAILAHQEANPQYQFIKKYLESTYKSPRMQQISSAIIESANCEKIVAILKQMVANPADFTFEFVGNIDVETLRPLLEQYVASLPVDKKKSISIKNLDSTLAVTGDTEQHDTYKMETPQVWAYITAFGHAEYNAKNRRVAYIAGQILGNRLLAQVREEMGATYSIGASCSIDPMLAPSQNTTVTTAFPCNPDMSKEVFEFIKGAFKAMADSVTAKEVAEQVEFLVKDTKEGHERNQDWVNTLYRFNQFGVDTYTGDIELLQSITAEDVKNFMKQLLEQGNYRVYTLNPEEAK